LAFLHEKERKMNATQNRKQGKSKDQRAVRIGDATNGVRGMTITDAKGVKCGYCLKELTVDFGRGFELTKFDTEEAADGDHVYHVHLDAQLGNSCTCKGFIHRDKCKHLDALRKLIEVGKV
jgi:hypothetical protein